MPELNLAPEPTRIPTQIIVISVVVLAVIAAAVFWFNPHKTAEITVTQERFFAPHTVSGALAGGGGLTVLGAGSAEDDLYVVADLKIDDELRLPLFVTSFAATLTSASGETVDGTVVTPHDMPRLEETFPALTPMLSQPLSLDTKIDAKASASGSVLLLFSGMTEADWKTKKAASLTIYLAHQGPLHVALP